MNLITTFTRSPFTVTSVWVEPSRPSYIELVVPKDPHQSSPLEGKIEVTAIHLVHPTVAGNKKQEINFHHKGHYAVEWAILHGELGIAQELIYWLKVCYLGAALKCRKFAQRSLLITCYNLRRLCALTGIDCRCDNRRFWLSARHCQVPTPASRNLQLELQIRIFFQQTNSAIVWRIEIHNS
jgi:hypothetical protein